ncbi:MAG: roadblock/LC7 domain-containing protein [Anaerolineae bacterium]|nr:roadblock/LC7 domain-containing protein [Anaerolineae bacterium]
METILKDINAVVGVTGSFVCDGEGQIVAKLMPNSFDGTLLSPVGRTIAQTIAGLKIAQRCRIGDIDLVYDEGRVIVKSIDEGCLCILCVKRVNTPLLNLTVNVAAKKLEEKFKEPKSVQPVAEVEPAPAPEPEPGPEPEPEPSRKMTLAEMMAANLRR